MAQSALTLSLPSLIITSSALDTSTQAVPAVDISDAVAISGFVSISTAPGFIAQVAYTTETTATFVPLIYSSITSTLALLGGSSNGIPIYLTSFAFTLAVSAKQFRIAASGVTSTTATVTLVKQVYV